MILRESLKSLIRTILFGGAFNCVLHVHVNEYAIPANYRQLEMHVKHTGKTIQLVSTVPVR